MIAWRYTRRSFKIDVGGHVTKTFTELRDSQLQRAAEHESAVIRFIFLNKLKGMSFIMLGNNLYFRPLRGPKLLTPTVQERAAHCTIIKYNQMARTG